MDCYRLLKKIVCKYCYLLKNSACLWGYRGVPASSDVCLLLQTNIYVLHMHETSKQYVCSCVYVHLWSHNFHTAVIKPLEFLLPCIMFVYENKQICAVVFTPVYRIDTLMNAPPIFFCFLVLCSTKRFLCVTSIFHKITFGLLNLLICTYIYTRCKCPIMPTN